MQHYSLYKWSEEENWDEMNYINKMTIIWEVHGLQLFIDTNFYFNIFDIWTLIGIPKTCKGILWWHFLVLCDPITQKINKKKKQSKQDT